MSHCSNITIEFDQYIPIKLIFGDRGPWIEPSAYWRSGNLDTELIEIGIGSEHGILRKITIVLIQKIGFHLNDYSKINCKSGIPIFRKINYDRNFLFDENGPLEMFVGKDKVQVLFSHNKITSGLVCDRVTCLFDKDDNFCGFEVADITDAEMSILKENFIDRLNQNQS